MTLQATTVARAIRHAIGGRSPSQDVGGEIDVMNRSGTVLWNMYEWDFTKRISTMSTVASQSYVNFPSDFERIISIEATDTLTNSVRLTSPGDLLWRRTYTLDQSNFNFYAAVFYRDNTGANGGAPEAVLEVHPTPQTAQTDIFTIAYRRRWPKISDDSDNIGIPEWCEELYIQLCREVAKGYEMDRPNENVPTLADRVSALKQSWLFEDAVRQDSSTQPDYGPIINGHVDTGTIYRDLGLHTIVPNP